VEPKAVEEPLFLGWLPDARRVEVVVRSNDHNKSTCEDDLLSEEFENLLRCLDDDREDAGERYEDIRRKLTRFFAWNDCFPEEDLADTTFDRVASKLATEQIHNIVAFIWGVAKNIKREFYRRPQPIDIEELPPGKSPQTGHLELTIIDEREAQRRRQCLQTCIQKLSDSERELFLDYEYYAGKAQKMESLTERLGLTMSALRTRAHRIKRRVEVCALECFSMGTKQTGL
jgi:DNA-directed RNA polymerase specialized sigma24 family protein